MPAAVEPSSKSTSTSMPTFSPTKGSTARTQGMDRRASHFALQHASTRAASSDQWTWLEQASAAEWQSSKGPPSEGAGNHQHSLAWLTA